MPFTFSHPAAILPFAKVSKRWLSLTGLVIGSITPDFEYFIRMKVESKYSHNWPGLFWFDLPLGLILYFIYLLLIKNKLINHLPLFLNRRFSVFKSTRPDYKYYLLIVAFSILIGAASHILWDSFTHPEGYFVKQMPVLKHHIFIAHHPFAIYNILQQLSSLMGAVIIAIVAWQLPEGETSKAASIIYYWLLVIAIAMVVLVIRLLTGLGLHQVGDMIVTFISGLLIGLVITSLMPDTKPT